jgi:hypothetical protein
METLDQFGPKRERLRATSESRGCYCKRRGARHRPVPARESIAFGSAARHSAPILYLL